MANEINKLFDMNTLYQPQEIEKEKLENNFKKLMTQHGNMQKALVNLLTEGKNGSGDFGTIVGTSGKCLFQNGATKIAFVLGTYPRFKPLPKMVVGDLLVYEYECELVSYTNGDVVMTSLSSACANLKATDRRGNSRADFECAKASAIAQKRAFVQATRKFAKLESEFTQDLEDTVVEESSSTNNLTAQQVLDLVKFLQERKNWKDDLATIITMVNENKSNTKSTKVYDKKDLKTLNDVKGILKLLTFEQYQIITGKVEEKGEIKNDTN